MKYPNLFLQLPLFLSSPPLFTCSSHWRKSLFTFKYVKYYGMSHKNMAEKFIVERVPGIVQVQIFKESKNKGNLSPTSSAF